MKSSPSTKANFLLLFLFFYGSLVFGQGYNHQWLLGSYNNFQDPKGRMLIDSNSSVLINENRKMVFKGTEANISDYNGNLLMSSNGIWIANATGDTMLNGSGLNPDTFASSNPYGLPLDVCNIFLPWPGDTTKYILFHHSAFYDGMSYLTRELFQSVIDITHDSGLGEVIIKNDTVLVDSLNWGMGACRHANGRDWWLILSPHNSSNLYKFYISPTGVFGPFLYNVNIPPAKYNSSQITFSSDGKKLCFNSYNPTIGTVFLVLMNFDRCSGNFSNEHIIQLDSSYNFIWGNAFSSSGNYLYACTSNYIFQIDVTTLSIDTVAIFDGFSSPSPPFYTTFWTMYLAANGKIYVTSGNGVQHLHQMNYPDSAGLSCDVQQHSIYLGYAQMRAVPNHPNYYLGCDTTSGCPCLTTSIDQPGKHNFKLSISPNPTSGNIKIVYLLPQSASGRKGGVFEIFDINGKRVFSYSLPSWSTMQNFSLAHLAEGIYNCVITSAGERVAKKLAVFNSGLSR